jgi:hypothetical protein
MQYLAPTLAFLLASLAAGLLPAAEGERRPDNLVNVSWGDQIMVASGDAQLDSPEKIRRAMRAWRDDHDGQTVLWRVAAEYIERFYEKRARSPFIRGYYDKVAEISARFKPATLARKLARQSGQRFLLYMTIFDHGAPTTELYGGTTPFPWQDRFTIAHPECQEVDRQGKPHWGVLEMAYPQSRQLMVDRIKQFVAEYDADGVYVCTRTHSLPAKHADQFGFGPPVVDEYRRRYGIDIRQDPRFDYASPHYAPHSEAVENWRRLRGAYVVEFYRQLRAALPGKTIYTGIPRGRYAGPPYGNRYLDWESLVREKLVDGLVVRVYAGKGLHTPLYVPHARIGYLSSEDDQIGIPDIRQAVHDVYGPLCQSHGVRLYVNGSCGSRERRWLATEPLLAGFMINTPNSLPSAVIPHADALCFPAGRGTIEAWVRLERLPRSVEGWPRVLSKYDHEDAGRHRAWEWIILPDGRFRFRVNQQPSAGSPESQDTALDSRDPLPLGRWLHLATVFDLPARQLRLYVAGRLDQARAIPAWPMRMNRDQDLYIGRYGGADSQRFPGLIDELRITSAALQFTAPPAGPYTGREPGTERLYHFDQFVDERWLPEARADKHLAARILGSPAGLLTDGPSPAFAHALRLMDPPSR